MLAGCAVTLRITLHWAPSGTGVPARQLPLLIEAAAAAAIGVVSRSPFGEPERATGRWLPFLRLGTAAALTAAALAALAAGSAAAHLDYGYLGLLRDLAGMTGIALLTAAVIGGGLCWAARWRTGCWPATPSARAGRLPGPGRPGRRTTPARRFAQRWRSPLVPRSSRCAVPAIPPASNARQPVTPAPPAARPWPGRSGAKIKCAAPARGARNGHTAYHITINLPKIKLVKFCPVITGRI